MSTKAKGGLGRGLAALIPTGPATTTVTDVLLNQGPPTPNGSLGHNEQNGRQSTAAVGPLTRDDAGSGGGAGPATRSRPSRRPGPPRRMAPHRSVPAISTSR